MADKLHATVTAFLAAVCAVLIVSAVAGCTYLDAAGGRTYTDGTASDWEVTMYNFLWGRTITLPSGAALDSRPALEGLQYIPQPRPETTP